MGGCPYTHPTTFMEMGSSHGIMLCSNLDTLTLNVNNTYFFTQITSSQNVLLNQLYIDHKFKKNDLEVLGFHYVPMLRQVLDSDFILYCIFERLLSFFFYVKYTKCK